MLEVTVGEKRWKLRKTIELYELGHSINEVAQKLGKSREGVRIQLEKAGVLSPLAPTSFKPRPPGRRGKVRRNSPYGFTYERGRVVQHPQEYQTFLIIRRFRESGLNSREIADRLNDQRLRPRTAKKWDRCTVHRILEWHQIHPEFIKEARPWESKD